MRGEDFAPQQSFPAGASKAEVGIDNFSFLPKESTVPVGTTVTWTNHDDVPACGGECRRSIQEISCLGH
jgi:plastocyanin